MFSAISLLFSWPLLFWIAYSIHAFWNRRLYARRNGCKEPSRLRQESWLGYYMLRESFRALRNSSYLRLGKQRFEENGDTFAFRQIGKLGVLTNDPANVKALLSSQFGDFGVGSRRAEAFEPLIGHGIFTADGTSWEKARRLIRPSFARGQLDDISIFEPHLQNLLSRLPTSSKAFDLQPLFQGLTLDVSTEFLFGESTNVLCSSKAHSDGRSFAEAFDRAQKTVVSAFALGGIAWLNPWSTFKEDQRTVQDFISKYVDKALSVGMGDHRAKEKETSRYSFVKEFSKLTDDRTLIYGGLLNLLLAGRDTTSSLLSNLFFVLAKHPEIYERLADEVRSATHGTNQIPSLEDLRSMKYLRGCINESLRLHPPIPRNSREALKDTTLPVGGGPDGTNPIFIPQGTQVGYQTFSMHRRVDVFGEDAESFIPERWTERNLRPGWAFLPFNGGPRVCIGQQFSLNLASYVVCRMVQEIESVESCDPSPWREGLGISCSTLNGSWVRLDRRY